MLIAVDSLVLLMGKCLVFSCDGGITSSSVSSKSILEWEFESLMCRSISCVWSGGLAGMEGLSGGWFMMKSSWRCLRCVTSALS